ncbi:hypothetical protein [Methylobacterium sp. Gmos1]
MIATPQSATIRTLAGLLAETSRTAGPAFTGVGVIVTAKPEVLPIFPLRPVSRIRNTEDVVSLLACISTEQSEYHDGFHVLSPDLRVALVAQYFSPPILPHAKVDRGKRFGGRYLAALFGSALPEVILTGIASRGFGVAIFESGAERVHEMSQ